MVPPHDFLPPAGPGCSPEVPGPLAPGTFMEGPTLDLLEYRDVELNEALRLFSQQTGLRVIASPEAGKKNISLQLARVNS